LPSIHIWPYIDENKMEPGIRADASYKGKRSQTVKKQ